MGYGDVRHLMKPDRPISGQSIPRGWHAQLWDWINSLEVYGDKSTVFTNKTSQGINISGKPFKQEIKSNAVGGGSSLYSGPFAVGKLTDTSVEVLGYSATDSQYWNNYIIAGLSRIEVADGASVAVTASGYVYIGITWNGSIYVATIAHAEALPAQDNAHIYIPLAYVVVTESKISSITQIQFGIIHFPARAG